MKTYWIIAALSTLIMTGCSVTKSTTDYDDVYSGISPKNDQPISSVNSTTTTNPDYSEQSKPVDYYAEDFESGGEKSTEDEPYLSTQETVTSPEGTNYITNNYYGSGYDDYYDYSYASRINRFYGPYIGYNYYSPFYTGFYYDPWYYDYYWYRPSFYFSYHWGWGDMYWGYPYYSYYYPYNSYWYGYNNGFWDGYYYGNWGYDYNGYGNSSYYYGHRPSRSGHNSPHSGFSKDEHQNNLATAQHSYFERTRPVIAENFSKSDRSSNTGGEVPGRQSTNSIINNRNPEINNDRNIVIKGENTQQNDISNPPQKEPVSGQRYVYKKPTANESRKSYNPGETIVVDGNNQKPVQRYSKPAGHSTSDNVSGSRQGSVSGNKNTQTYSRPQSTQNDSYSRPTKYNTENNKQNQPIRSSENYNKPSRSDNNSYSQPSRSSNSYSQPSRSSNSRSYSAPSNSGGNKSYSSPSRSGNSGSYSSPSRSGSNSSGSSSRGGRK